MLELGSGLSVGQYSVCCNPTSWATGDRWLWTDVDDDDNDNIDVDDDDS